MNDGAGASLPLVDCECGIDHLTGHARICDTWKAKSVSYFEGNIIDLYYANYCANQMKCSRDECRP
jgi:hypothetical protein